jgi:N-acetyltransferase
VRESAFRPPVTLRGVRVTLAPLGPEHRDALAAAARDPEIGRFLVEPPGPDPPVVGGLIEKLLARQAAGTDLPFVVLETNSGRPVGGTRYLNIDRPNDVVEIGGTWYERALWRTPVNTECKLLLLRHAFETEGAHRVQLQTDLRNERSQRAIARLGAVREGVLREHRRLADGYRRSSVVYGIVASEWPAVRRRLEGFLARPWPPAPSPTA